MTGDPRAATIAISELDGGDPAAVEGAYEVCRLARAHDTPDFPEPCRYRFEALFSVPWPGHDDRRFIAHDGATVLGYLEVAMFTLDNLDSGDIMAAVPPAHRQQGIGRRLYRHAVEVLRANGRKRAFAFTPFTLPGGVERDPAGTAFAEAMGMTNALDEIRRRLDVSTVDNAEHDHLLAAAWAKADGYSLVQWTGRTPDDCVDDVATLDGRLLEDSPIGDLVLEPEKVDAARVRGMEDARARYGVTPFGTAVRHDATGRVVAFTVLTKARGHAHHASQGTTLVDPAHRGRRLGTIVKIENLRQLRRLSPTIRYIDTYNADENAQMISINEAVGFRAVDGWRNLQVDL